jgi:methanogenic corrinoid protein MtbC1
MPDDYFSAMRQSIIEGAPDTASGLAKEALASGVPPIDAINNGFAPGMHDVGQQFARGQMFLPDMMASAEAMRAAMAGSIRNSRGWVPSAREPASWCSARPKATSMKLGKFSSGQC